MGIEYYERAASRVPAPPREHDLFLGVRP
jgi:hypothetical protein